MDIQAITAQMRDRVGDSSGLNATLKFAFEDGFIYIDGKSTPNTVTNEDKPADCTIKVKFADFIQISEGKMDPTTAFMMGKLKVEGNTAVAMKLGPIMQG